METVTAQASSYHVPHCPNLISRPFISDQATTAWSFYDSDLPPDNLPEAALSAASWRLRQTFPRLPNLERGYSLPMALAQCRPRLNSKMPPPEPAVSNLSLLQAPLPASPRYDSRRTGGGARREQKNFVDEGLSPSNASVASVG